MGVGALLGLVGEFCRLSRLFVRDWKWGFSNPIFDVMPNEQRALGLDD